MRSNLKVSILIPCYNSEKFISDALQSCIDQSYSNIEIIIVDDGSQDNTLEIARHWESRYNKIRVYSQPNSGACKARNLAFEKSSGDFIMYLDADDIISHNKISEQINALKDTPWNVVASCKWDRFYNDINEAQFPSYICYQNYSSGINLLLDLWNNGEMFQTSCYLVHRELIQKAGPWREILKKNQDGEFFSRVLMYTQNVVFCPDARVYYRSGDYTSVSKDDSVGKLVSLLDSFKMYEKILEFEDSSRTRNALARNFSLFCYLYNTKFPDLCDEARREVKALNVKMPIVGTSRFVFMAKILGLRGAFWVRKHILKY